MSAEDAYRLLPHELRAELNAVNKNGIEELRLRCDRPLSIVRAGEEYPVGKCIVSTEMLHHVLEKASGASMHSAMQTLSNGFISYRGLRIGVCGEAVMSGGEFRGYRNYYSLNIRIPADRRLDFNELAGGLYEGGLCSALIISPPGAGKTTLLREIVHYASESGTRVGVIDERNELSGSIGSESAYPLGRCTDVITMAPKKMSAMILLRGMSPQMIAMDEISAEEDAETIREICGCGVKILATAHAGSVEEMKKREIYRDILSARIFDKAISIGIHDGRRVYTLEEFR